jgi:hypothetical protein
VMKFVPIGSQHERPARMDAQRERDQAHGTA